jgi:type VI secretion system protein ImpL
MSSPFTGVPTWVHVVAAAVVASIVLAAIAYLVLRRPRVAARVPDGVEDMPSRVRAAFAAASVLLRTRGQDRIRAFVEGPAPSARDLARRLLVLGLPGSGKTALLQQLSRGETFASPTAKLDAAPCNLFRLDGAIAVDVAGRVLGDQGANGEGGEAFRVVLTELRRAFPDRPVDGIVVTLSCADLLSPPPRDKCEEWARQLRRRIDEAGSRLAMRVPVYLLVTQCDRIPSFDSFCREIDDERRTRMLGWSSPSEPFAAPGQEDAAREAGADWTSEALSSVARALGDEQQHRFNGDVAPVDASGYFLFPAALTACGDALRWFIDPVFHDPAGGPPPALRGVYFCGRGPDESSPVGSSMMPPAGASSPPPALIASSAPADSHASGAVSTPPARPILFAADLFARKVLPESNLAQPSAAAQRRRVGAIRALQVASAVVSVVWAVALIVTLGSVERRATTLSPYLHALASTLIQVKGDSDDPAARAAVGESRARAVELLDKLGDVGASRLRSFAVPTSLPSRLDARLEDAIAYSYDKVILDAYRRALMSHELIAPEPLPPADTLDLAGTIPLEKTPEFLRAERWLQRLSLFEANAVRYNKLVRLHEAGGADEREIQELADLSESLLGHKVDQRFFSNAKYYVDALAHPMTAAPFDLGALAPAVRKVADEVFEPLQNRLLELSSESAVRGDLESLNKRFDAVEVGGPDYSTERLRELRQAIERAEGDFGRAGLSWVAGDTVPAPPELDRLRKSIEGLRLLGPDAATRLRNADEARLRKLQNLLKHAEMPLPGPVLARQDGALQMKLAPAILALKGPIDSLLHQSYMAGDEQAQGALDLTDVRVTWDVERLLVAAKVAQEHEAFTHDGGFKAYPDRVQSTLTALALRRVRGRALGLVAGAARREVDAGGARVPDSVIRSDADNLALAGGPLRELLASLTRLQIDDARTQVRAVVRSQGVRILKSASQALDGEALYRVHGGSFSWWTGEGPPAFAAFEVADTAQLAEYVVEQRSRVQALSKSAAEPVLALLQSPEVNAQSEAVVTAWDQTATALRDFEGKKAGNSVASLERLIQTDLATVTGETCLTALETPSGRARVDDYFGERRRIIHDLARARCTRLSSEDMHDWYARLRRDFQRTIAERFPFSRNEQAEDAAPEAVKSFLLDAEGFRKRYRTLLEQRRDTASQQVVRFIDKLDRVRAFLEPLWAQGEGGDGGAYTLKVEFRANTARESGANEIADWSLRLGEAQLDLGAAKASAKWRPGDAVRAQLRWAKNSPNMPVASPGLRLKVEGRLVTFDERGPWALLRLIAAHENAPQDRESSRDAAQLLLFEVRTMPDPGGGFIDRTGTDAGAARGFIGLTISGSGKDKERALKYPQFPTSAADAPAL